MEIQVTTSLDEMLKNPDIKAVAVSTPAATRNESAKQSLLEGKNVLSKNIKDKDLTPVA